MHSATQPRDRIKALAYNANKFQIWVHLVLVNLQKFRLSGVEKILLSQAGKMKTSRK